MKKEHSDQIILKAIQVFGVKSQFEKADEECIELSLAIKRFLSKRPNAMDNLIEEIADAEIMIDQLKIMIEKNAEIELMKEFKLLRLEKKLNEINYEMHE